MKEPLSPSRTRKELWPRRLVASSHRMLSMAARCARGAERCGAPLRGDAARSVKYWGNSGVTLRARSLVSFRVCARENGAVGGWSIVGLKWPQRGKKRPPTKLFFGRVGKSSYFCRRNANSKDMKKTDGQPEPRGLKWWVHLIIAILSAIAGALGGMQVIAPAITNIH